MNKTLLFSVATRALRVHNDIEELIVLQAMLAAREVIRGDVVKLAELAGELKVGFVGSG